MLATEPLLDELTRRFPDVDPATARVVRAPGRVNLIGEHTDYNEGYVLPAAIDLETWIAAAPSGDTRVELVLDDGRRSAFDLAALEPAQGSWIDTVAGMAWSLSDAGIPLRGIRGVVATEIPIGSGLSSSAAMQLAAAWAMSDALPPLPPMDLARAAQRAENGYVGVRSGIMDQFASAHGTPGHALLLDCRSLEFRTVPLPMDEHTIVACDTRLPRRLEASEYNARRAQCEEAVRVLSGHVPEIRSLRDVDPDLLDRYAEELDPVVLRRARHVVTENVRVLETVSALESGQLGRLSELWAASHRSLRDCYDVTSPELDALVASAASTPGVLGSRMTGAGFGGCTVALVRRDAVEELRQRVAQDFRARFGRDPGFYHVEPATGAGEVSAR
jgi:galactokinase